MKDRLELKISPSDKAIIKAQAKKYGLTTSGYVRLKLLNSKYLNDDV